MYDLDFDRVYAEYFTEVYKFALTLCQNADLAEEITQETFFKALKNIDNFNGNCRIGSWLCQIAKNTFYDTARRHGHQTTFDPETLISPENLEEKLTDSDTAISIHKALHRLKEPYKEVFWLRTFGELSFAQISALFDKSESWARVTYHRARLLIKEELQ